MWPGQLEAFSKKHRVPNVPALSSLRRPSSTACARSCPRLRSSVAKDRSPTTVSVMPCARAAEQCDEVASLQPIKLHAIPASMGRTAGYRFRGGESAGTPAESVALHISGLHGVKSTHYRTATARAGSPLRADVQPTHGVWSDARAAIRVSSEAFLIIVRTIGSIQRGGSGLPRPPPYLGGCGQWRRDARGLTRPSRVLRVPQSVSWPVRISTSLAPRTVIAVGQRP
jgi:hypothetical protein